MKLHDIMRFASDERISKEKLAAIVDAAFLQKQTQAIDATQKKDNGWRTTEQGKHYKINPKSGQIVAGNIGVAKPGDKVDPAKKTGKAQAKRAAAAAKASSGTRKTRKSAPSLYVAPQNKQKNQKWHQRNDRYVQRAKKDSVGSYKSATAGDLLAMENGTKVSYQLNGAKYTGVKKQAASGTYDHWVMQQTKDGKTSYMFYRDEHLADALHRTGGKFNIMSSYQQQRKESPTSSRKSRKAQSETTGSAKSSMQRSVENGSIRGAAASMDKYKPGTTITFTDKGKKYTYTKQPDKDGMPGAWLQNGTKNGFAVSSDIASAIIRNGGDFDVDWDKAGSPGGSLNMQAKSGTTPSVTQRIASFKDEIANDPKWSHLKDYTHVLGASDQVPTQQQTKEMHAKKLGNISSKLKPYAKSRYEHIVGEQPQITSDIVGVCRDIGASMFGLPFRLKDAKDNSQGVCRIDEKIRQDIKKKGMTYQQATDGLGDIARYTQACTSDNMVDNFNRTRQALQAKGYQFTKVKNTWDTFSEKNAYRGLNCTVMTPNGIPFELQFHTPQSLATKEAQHKLYEQARTEGTPADRVAQLNRIMLANAKLLPRPAGIQKIVSEQRAYNPKSKSSDSAKRINAAKRKNPLFDTRKSFGDF